MSREPFGVSAGRMVSCPGQFRLTLFMTCLPSLSVRLIRKRRVIGANCKQFHPR